MGRIFEVRKASMFARWDRMAKQFTRIGKEIVIAVKAGGPEPARPEVGCAHEYRARGHGSAPMAPAVPSAISSKPTAAQVSKESRLAHRACRSGPTMPSCLP